MMNLIVISLALGTCLYLALEYLGDVKLTLFYGKVRSIKSSARWQIPKSRFKDMYTVGLLHVILVCFVTIRLYCYGDTLSKGYVAVLDFIGGGPGRTMIQSKFETSVGLSFMFLQLLRRFYETHCMQIFSKDSHLNTIFYLATLGYYPALITGIIVTSPGFADGVDNNNNSVNWRHITGMGIFLFSWWNQFRSNRILVNLRKDSSGKIVTEKHYLPFGEFFELISCPHMFFEILIYVSLVLVLPLNLCVIFNLVFVAANQLTYAKATHNYYLQKFPEYPKNRKMIIPYIY